MFLKGLRTYSHISENPEMAIHGWNKVPMKALSQKFIFLVLNNEDSKHFIDFKVTNNSYSPVYPWNPSPSVVTKEDTTTGDHRGGGYKYTNSARDGVTLCLGITVSNYVILPHHKTNLETTEDERCKYVQIFGKDGSPLKGAAGKSGLFLWVQCIPPPDYFSDGEGAPELWQCLQTGSNCVCHYISLKGLCRKTRKLCCWPVPLVTVKFALKTTQLTQLKI